MAEPTTPPAGDGGAPPVDTKALELKINELTESVTKLEGNNKSLVEEKRKAEAELKVLKDKGKDATELLPQKELEIETLKTKLSEIETAKVAEETKRKELETSIRDTYLKQLPENHRGIAALIPTVEGLAEYVKLNVTAPPPANNGKPGNGIVDTTGKKWNDFNDDELTELRKSNFNEYARLYKSEYGIIPSENY